MTRPDDLMWLTVYAIDNDSCRKSLQKVGLGSVVFNDANICSYKGNGQGTCQVSSILISYLITFSRVRIKEQSTEV